jgi:hypothetical protein
LTQKKLCSFAKVHAAMRFNAKCLLEDAKEAVNLQGPKPRPHYSGALSQITFHKLRK